MRRVRQVSRAGLAKSPGHGLGARGAAVLADRAVLGVALGRERPPDIERARILGGPGFEQPPVKRVDRAIPWEKD